jgi:phosphoglycerate dehydrogenase-like enzyme
VSRLHDALPSRWKLVSTAPLPVENVRRFLPAGTDADVVVVEPRTEDAAVEAVVDADIVIGDYLFEIPLSRRVIERMERCRLIQQPSVGYQQIDVTAAAAQGIAVANVAGANDTAVAEHTVMVAVALMRELPLVDREVRGGEWPQLTRPHFELAGKTWGIVGFGRIGRKVAQRLQGWEVELLYHDALRAPREVEQSLSIAYAELDDLLARADVVSLHVPLVDSTRALLDAGRLAAMKPSAYLVNVARGEVVDERALIDALRDGRLRGAALDVFGTEPLPRGHPLTELENVILTPHAAGTVMEARIRLLKLTAANVTRVVRGELPIDVVNGML